MLELSETEAGGEAGQARARVGVEEELELFDCVMGCEDVMLRPGLLYSAV